MDADAPAFQQSLFQTNQQVSTSSDDYYTPTWVFDALGLTYDLDPAHPPWVTSVPTRRFYTQADDGLAQPWEGLVWLNPPFSKPTQWIDRWIGHNNGILLCPYAKSNWFDRLYQSEALTTTLPNKMKFNTTNGDKGIFMPSALWALGDQAKQALHDSKIGKVR